MIVLSVWILAPPDLGLSQIFIVVGRRLRFYVTTFWDFLRDVKPCLCSNVTSHLNLENVCLISGDILAFCSWYKAKRFSVKAFPFKKRKCFEPNGAWTNLGSSCLMKWELFQCILTLKTEDMGERLGDFSQNLNYLGNRCSKLIFVDFGGF